MDVAIRPLSVANPLLEIYREAAEHQRSHEAAVGLSFDDPAPTCTACMLEPGWTPEPDPRSSFAWAVPTAEAINTIADISPIGVVEPGAGLGYWAALLADAGVNVYAYDIEPAGNPWCRGAPFFDVVEGGARVSKDHPDCTLLLCWPPHDEPMAADALAAYAGDTLVYVGEQHGCTASPAFQRELVAGWDLEMSVGIPTWRGLHDRVWVYRRR